MLFQQRQKLVLKRQFAVMRFLSCDVFDGFVQLRHAYAERAVFLLPREQPMFGKCFMNPF